MRGKHIVLGTLALFTILVASASLAVGLNVGVQAGNYFTYKILSATSNADFFGVDNYTITISNVTGSVVNYQFALNYPNGTTTQFPSYTDLANGSSAYGGWIIVYANQQAGDPVYPGWSWLINETVTKDGRLTNRLAVTDAFMNNSGRVNFVTADIYCDQATGAVVNASMSISDQSHQFVFSQSYTLTGSNVWIVVPEFAPIILMLTTAALTTCAAAIAYRRKREP